MVPGTVLLPLPLGHSGNVCYSYFGTNTYWCQAVAPLLASTIRENLYQRKEGFGMGRCADVMRAGRSPPVALAAVQGARAASSGRRIGRSTDMGLPGSVEPATGGRRSSSIGSAHVASAVLAKLMAL